MELSLQLRTFVAQFVENQEISDLINRFDKKFITLTEKEIIEIGNLDIVKYIHYRRILKNYAEFIFWSFVYDKQNFIDFLSLHINADLVQKNKLYAKAYKGKKDEFIESVSFTNINGNGNGNGNNELKDFDFLVETSTFYNDCFLFSIYGNQLEMAKYLYIYTNTEIGQTKQYNKKFFNQIIKSSSEIIKYFIPILANFDLNPNYFVFTDMFDTSQICNILLRINEDDFNFILKYDELLDYYVFSYDRIKRVFFHYLSNGENENKKIFRFLTINDIQKLSNNVELLSYLFKSPRILFEEKEEIYKIIKEKDVHSLLPSIWKELFTAS